MQHILLDSLDEAVQRFFLSLPVDAEGSVVELNGHALACLVSVPSASAVENGDWTEAKNNRRCDLIDKEIDGTLTPTEAIELRGLQQAMLRHRRRAAPLPLEAARKLYARLLEKSAKSTE